MAELLIALAPIALVSGFALLVLLVPFKLIVIGAVALVGLGWLLGIPGGVYYHVALRRELRARGSLPPGWYWHPQRHFASLGPSAQRRLYPWFLLGGLGFMLIISGFALAVSALFLWFRGGASGVLP